MPARRSVQGDIKSLGDLFKGETLLQFQMNDGALFYRQFTQRKFERRPDRAFVRIVRGGEERRLLILEILMISGSRLASRDGERDRWPADAPCESEMNVDCAPRPGIQAVGPAS